MENKALLSHDQAHCTIDTGVIAEARGLDGRLAAGAEGILLKVLDQRVEEDIPCAGHAAAHEEHFGLDRLYALCEIAYELVKPYNIGRIIARPFIGEKAGSFTRTARRRDFTAEPFGETLLDRLKATGKNVIAIGAINDIYAHRGITKGIHGSGLQELWDLTLAEIKTAPEDSLIFTNFEDFDMLWGHRRDINGYAQGLEYFDSRLAEIEAVLRPDDIVFITADHGNDPSYNGTDHTREQVPVLMFGLNVKPENIGQRDTYADLGQTIAAYFNLKPFDYGKSFL